MLKNDIREILEILNISSGKIPPEIKPPGK